MSTAKSARAVAAPNGNGGSDKLDKFEMALSLSTSGADAFAIASWYSIAAARRAVDVGKSPIWEEMRKQQRSN